MAKILGALFWLMISLSPLHASVLFGVDVLFEDGGELLRGKRVGLITNRTGQDRMRRSTLDLFTRPDLPFTCVALFGPEHGLQGSHHAGEKVTGGATIRGVPVYSLYGETRRPTSAMLEGIDLLVFDIQDVGLRCYTYASTLYYAMEEAAARGIVVVVLDRPNPINGLVVDGPMLDPAKRSFLGYVDIPLCHGMTIGELARYFNAEYEIGCELQVVAMRGWKRAMSYQMTHLPWTPTSPQIPEADTPLYYAMTSVIGEVLKNVSIGVGYTLPFKVVGAPWMDGAKMAKTLNKQAFPGVHFEPYLFVPFFDRLKGVECSGVRLVVTDPILYRPVSTQFLILGTIKSLYPKEFREGLGQGCKYEEMLGKVVGSDEPLQLIREKRYVTWPLIAHHRERREVFLAKRAKYLLYP